MTPQLIYIGTSRLHRVRANVIQTLHTAAAFERLGVAARLYLPPWKRYALKARLAELGIGQEVDVRASRLLHSRWRRWHYWPFMRCYRGALNAARARYTRTPQISAGLAAAGLRHSLEIHDTRALGRDGLLKPVVAWQRTGLIEWLVAISQAAAAALVEAGADPGRIHVAPSGVDLEAFAGVPPFDPARLARPRVVYLGRISRSRGLDVLRTLAERDIVDVTLVGEQEDAIAPLARLHVMPAVAYREIPAWYGRADLILLPYQADLGHIASISPMKLFEAMASGRPIIASDIAPIREILTDGETGLLVPSDDAAAWVAAIERLQRDPALAVRLAANARAAAPRYSWRERAEGIARVLGLLA